MDQQSNAQIDRSGAHRRRRRSFPSLYKVRFHIHK